MQQNASTPQLESQRHGMDAFGVAAPGKSSSLLRAKAIVLARLLGLAVYAVAVFWSCIQREPRWWSLLPFLLPLFYWTGAALARRSGRPHLFWPIQGALAAVLAILLVWLAQHQSVWLASPQRVRLFYFVQEGIMFALIVAVFVRSLLPGRTPLCSAMAMLSHPVMTPAVWRYTRNVTLAWALWIAGLWLVSALLFVAAKVEAWAFFSAVMVPVLTAAFFLLEVAAGRRIFLPRQDRSSLVATLASVRRVNWAAFFLLLIKGGNPGLGALQDGARSAGAK